MEGKTRLQAYRTPLLQFIADWNRSPSKSNVTDDAPLLHRTGSIPVALFDQRLLDKGTPHWWLPWT